MSDIAIKVEGLGKRYRLGQRASYRRLTETLTNLATAPLRSFRNKSSSKKSERNAESVSVTDTFWALDDVSFEIKRGSVVGIIGRNGAGKSTLLKILSRITEPTTGDVWLHGRIGSLLEVGTGFHPELTGRENIFLNGAILGMRRREIQSKFDEIVAFSEVEKFLDTPVKHYSNGMYMRLAFAVAAHLEPEILLVDEVLAVGDADFQSKCMGKIDAVAKNGRTVLFVSHNMAAIERLCSSAILFSNGSLERIAPPREAITHYLASNRHSSYSWQRSGEPPAHPHFKSANLYDEHGALATAPTTASRLHVEIEFFLPSQKRHLVIAVGVFNEIGYPLFSTSPLDDELLPPDAAGVHTMRVVFPEALFLAKRYSLTLAMYDGHQNYDQQDAALSFVVAETASFGNRLPTGRIGDIQFRCSWRIV